jgi:GcrA cell cycle regulator
MAFGWTEEAIEQLKKLWADGLSTSAIGRALGCSKNAVVSKVHRISLPSRPSPIRKSDDAVPLKMTPTAIRRRAGYAARASSQAGSKFDSPRLVAVPIQRVREIVAQQKSVARDPHKRCLFTSGQRETGYVCCDQLVAIGSPFCPDHRRLGARREAA